jgi:hypothetical protein
MKLFLTLLISALLFCTLTAKHSNKVKLIKSKQPVEFLSTPYGASIDRLDLKFPYLVNADFGSAKDNLMAVSLFNSHIFVSNCPNVFRYFNCSNFQDSCVQFPKIRFNADFPFFSVAGTRILLNMTLGNYGRGRRVKAFYADECTRNSFGNNDVVGSVGFSLNESNIFNLDTENNKFAIWLDKEKSDGTMIFGDDSDFRGDEPPLRMMGVTSNWEIPLESIVLLDLMYDFNGKALFDINSNFIGLPDDLYNRMLGDLKSRWNFVCDKQIYQPNCSYTKDISELPNLIIMPSLGNNPITLSPDLYLNKLDNNLFQLLFVSLSTKPIYGHQIFVTNTYLNYVILGAPFFRHYYTVFNYQDMRNPEIDFYVPSKSIPNSEGGLSPWAILGIVLGALLLLGIIIGSIYAFRKSRDRKRQETLVNPETRVNYVAYNQ